MYNPVLIPTRGRQLKPIAVCFFGAGWRRVGIAFLLYTTDGQIGNDEMVVNVFHPELFVCHTS